jgi:hypothetical protein
MDDLTLAAQVREIADLIAEKMDDEHANRQFIIEDALWRLDRLTGAGWQRGARVWDDHP